MNLGHFLTPYTKINSKWMKDINVRQEAVKILEEKVGKNLFDLGHSTFLLNMSLEARVTKANRDLTKIKASAQQRKESTKLKGNQRNRKIFANDISDKGLVSKIDKELTPEKQIIQ